MKIFTRLLLLIIAFSFIIIEESNAIPAFARKYGLSCQTCHSPAPRLKDYGDEFAGNGFRLSDKQSPRYYMETGDDKLSLLRDFPLAVRFDGHISYNNANSEKPDFGVPYILKLLSGGEITDNIAYYFYFYMSERGELAGVEDCYIMFNNLFGIDFDIYFGQFQVSDPLFKRELRLTLEDYQIYKAKPGPSQMNFAYDRGFMFTLGLETGTDIIFEVVNGCGLKEADADKLFDIDKYKTFVGRVSQDVFDFLRIGGIVLTGKEVLGENTITNQVFSYGADMTINYDDILELNLQYIQRKDDNLILDAESLNGVECNTKGAMAELIFTPNKDDSNWYAAALFNWVESDFKPIDYKTASLHFGYLLKRNLRLVLEGNYNFTNSDKPFGQVSLGFVTAF